MVGSLIAPVLAALGLVTAASSTSAVNLDVEKGSSLVGTWVMRSAYEVLPDGTRTTTYGEHPLGMLTVDAAGRYSLQIFRVGRPAFASGDKARGTPEEYKQAIVGASTHFGIVSVDSARHQLVFDVQGSSFPNWEGKRQTRDYTLKAGLLEYAVPASASSSGVIAHSLWRRAQL